MQNLVLIVAAGRGNRFGGELPKQYQLLEGKPVLIYSIEAFLKHARIDKVRVVINAEDEKLYNDAVRDLKSKKLLPPVVGGRERQDSVRLGLRSVEEFNPKNVLIHDAARPYISNAVIDNVLAALQNHSAVIPAVSAADSARYNGEAIARDALKMVQTPQGFDYQLILDAHKKAKGLKVKFTDDAQVAESVGMEIFLAEGDVGNKKVTVQSDLDAGSLEKTADRVLGVRAGAGGIRVGIGFDVHEFETGTHVTICGVKVPHSHQLKGHSDADVGLHALTDAILGAIGEGDIGEHFPPSEAKWRNVESPVFVKHALGLMRGKGGEIGNVDITIICEEPKLTPFKAEMRKFVAGVLGVTEDFVNVKATTTEKLGFTGRKEGIAAHAVASVRY